MLLAIIHDAFKNLSANLLRSGLTMLGVIIGVASVIAMIAIVEGGQVWRTSAEVVHFLMRFFGAINETFEI